jgi:hypothetical protein
MLSLVFLLCAGLFPFSAIGIPNKCEATTNDIFKLCLGSSSCSSESCVARMGRTLAFAENHFGDCVATSSSTVLCIPAETTVYPKSPCILLSSELPCNTTGYSLIGPTGISYAVDGSPVEWELVKTSDPVVTIANDDSADSAEAVSAAAGGGSLSFFATLATFVVVAVLVALGRRTPHVIGLRMRRAFSARWSEFGDPFSWWPEAGASHPDEVSLDSVELETIDASPGLQPPMSSLSLDSPQADPSAADHDRHALAAYARWRRCAALVIAFFLIAEFLENFVQTVVSLAQIKSNFDKANERASKLRGEFLFVTLLFGILEILIGLYRIVVFGGAARGSVRWGSRMQVRMAYFSQFYVIPLVAIVPVGHLRYANEDAGTHTDALVRSAIILGITLRIVTLVGPVFLSLFPALAAAAVNTKQIFPHVGSLGRLVQTAAIAQGFIVLVLTTVVLLFVSGAWVVTLAYASALLLLFSQFARFRVGRTMLADLGEYGGPAWLPVVRWQRIALASQVGAITVLALILLAWTHVLGSNWHAAVSFAARMPAKYLTSLVFASDLITQAVAGPPKGIRAQ